MADELKKNMLNDDKLNEVVGGVTYSPKLIKLLIFHSADLLHCCNTNKNSNDKTFLESVDNTIHNPVINQFFEEWLAEGNSRSDLEQIIKSYHSV